MTVFRDVFHRASSHIPCGVGILAGVDAQQGRFGLTLSSVTCVSLEPALVAVCIKSRSRRIEQLRQTKEFSINLLERQQAALAAKFAGRDENRFAEGSWHADENGVPVLTAAVGTLICRFDREFEAGDHRMIFGEVCKVILRGGEPLVYWRRAFHKLDVRYPIAESEAEMERFVARWTEGKLTKEEWTHGAHVGVAAFHAFEHRGDELFERMKSGIIFHNTCVGTKNSEDSGYHETLTRFWARTVEEFVDAGRFGSRLEAVRAALARFGEDRDRHRLFYSFDVVNDRRARREWIAPDRQAALAFEQS